MYKRQSSFFELNLARYLIRIELLRAVHSMFTGDVGRVVPGALGEHLANMTDESEKPTPGVINYPILFQIPTQSGWHNIVGILTMFGYKCFVPNLSVIYYMPSLIRQPLVVWNGLRNGIGVNTEEFILFDTSNDDR